MARMRNSMLFSASSDVPVYYPHVPTAVPRPWTYCECSYLNRWVGYFKSARASVTSTSWPWSTKVLYGHLTINYVWTRLSALLCLKTIPSTVLSRVLCLRNEVKKCTPVLSYPKSPSESFYVLILHITHRPTEIQIVFVRRGRLLEASDQCRNLVTCTHHLHCLHRLKVGRHFICFHFHQFGIPKSFQTKWPRLVWKQK